MKTTRRNMIAGVASLAAGAGAAKGQTPEVDPAAFLAVFPKRQTVRRYKPDPVPDEHVRQILDAARRGPTCMNQQPWKFLVIRDKQKIQAMRKKTLDQVMGRFDAASAKKTDAKPEEVAAQRSKQLNFFEGYFTAPVYVVVLVDAQSPCSGYALKHDGPIAAGYLMLAARAFGYGTAYLTDGIPGNIVREVLAIPERYQSICITPIGVPDHWERKEKRKLDEMIVYETMEGNPPHKPVEYKPL